MGMKSDLRGKEKVKKYLERFKENMKMDKEAKEDFDAEKLANPYSDTRVLVDNNKKQIKENFGRCRYGRERRSCSPINWALIWLSLIIRRESYRSARRYNLQAQVLADYGVPINIAEAVIKPRIEVSRYIADKP